MLSTINMLGETEKSSDVCRTASLSEMGHGQRAATSSTVTDQRRKNFFCHSLTAAHRSINGSTKLRACVTSSQVYIFRGHAYVGKVTYQNQVTRCDTRGQVSWLRVTRPSTGDTSDTLYSEKCDCRPLDR